MCHASDSRHAGARRWQRGAVPRRSTVLVALALALVAAACGEAAPDRSVEAVDPQPGSAAVDDAGATTEREPVTEMTWTTTYDVDGFGYVLTVEGTVGDDHAAYSMHVDLLLGSDDGGMEELLPGVAGAAVNGLAPGADADTELLGIDPEGRTEVRVVGDERWYRAPWLLAEADHAVEGAEWVRVDRDEEVLLDIVTAVLNERYDDALRRLLDDVGSGTELTAPTPDEASTELDELLTPWIGLAGPAYPIGGEATVAGDADAGEATWTQVLTYEPHGADGALSGRVRWARGEAVPPVPPDPDDVTTAAEVSARLSG
jgi:hypothetical protein